MAKAVLLVHSRPSDPSREDEFNEWYDKTHVPEVCAVPGFVSARRFKLGEAAIAADPDGYPYLAIYEIDADDPQGALKELAERAMDGRVAMSDAIELNPPPRMTLYDALG